MKKREIAPLLPPAAAIMSRESLYCSNISGGNKCGILASVEAVQTVIIEGIQTTRIRRFCGQHATKFAINATGWVRFDKIPFPTLGEKS